MRKYFLALLAVYSLIALTGCAASEAAQEEQHNTELKNSEQSTLKNANGASAQQSAAKSIAPITH